MSKGTLVQDPVKAKEYFEAKMAFTLGPVELSHKLEEGAGEINVIDVRAAEDYALGRIPGAKNLPKEGWETAEGLEKDKINIIYCYSQTCHLAAAAALTFLAKGHPVMEMEGGIEAWKRSGLKLEK